MLENPLSDFFKDTVEVSFDIFIGKSQEPNTVLFQFPLPPFVFFHTLFVRSSIDLHC